MTTTDRTRTFWSLGLSPAQGWIAEARRSRDLLAGSRALAWLMGRLLVFLRDRRAMVRLPELEEPAFRSFGERFGRFLAAGSSGVSNHASGWVEAPLGEAEALFRELDDRLAALWGELCGEVVADARRSAEDLWDVAGPAIGAPPCPLHLTWTLLETSADVEEGLREVDAVYAAAKRSRPVPPHAGAPVRKCGQCGRREAMGGDEPLAWRRFQETLGGLDEVKRGLRFEAGEYLCPTCALRRFAGYLDKEAFPSTSALAASDWLWRVASSDDLRALLRALEGAAEKVPGYEPRWADRAPLLYRRSLDRAARAAAGDAAATAALAAVRQRQTDLARAIHRYNLARPGQPSVLEGPPEYLAVLVFDGDDMGRKLREDLAGLPRRVVEFQGRLAERFDRKERREEDRPLGHPFYLGGDEGLFLAPVGTVLELARTIRATWDETAGAADGKPSLSFGIALFDRERPLYAAIESARRALGRAKQVEGKRSVGLAVQTASGSAWTAVVRQGEEWERLEEAVALLREGKLAGGWPHDVERLLRGLSGEVFRAGDETRAALREEVRRLTRRRCDEEHRDEVWRRLNGKDWWRQQPDEEVIASVAEHLHAAAFIARAAGPAAAPDSPEPSVAEGGGR